MMFKFKTFGARGFTCQQDRIDQGFVSIGGVRDDLNPDFIYCNDSGYYDEAIKFKKEISPNAKLILNVLDIPSMYVGKNFDLNKLYIQLKQADIVTSISQFVQGQLLYYFNIESNIIYNPIKDINNEQRKNGVVKYPQFKAMLVGRVNDPYKRGDLAIQSLIMAGFQEKDVVIVGSENPNWGSYLGVVSDEVLNDLYNSVDFILMTSNFEGLGLVAIEGMAGGAIPIICSDLTTVSEFYPRRWWNHPSPQCISLYIRKLIDNSEIMKYEKEYVLKSYVPALFGKKQIAKRIFDVYIDKFYKPSFND